MNEEMNHGVCLKVGGATEELKVSLTKPAPDQVRFTESVTMVTDPELKFPPFVKQKTQGFPHSGVNKLRVFVKPIL